MLNTVFNLIKSYFFRPLFGRVVLTLLTLAGTALLLSSGADIRFSTEGKALGNTFSISYENKASFWPGFLLFIALVALAIWIFFKVGSPSLLRSEQITKLEEAYRKKGNQDSVCTLFREVHNVYVSPDELDELMNKPETTERARTLRAARSHVKFSLSAGFELKKPSHPYRLLSAIFTGVYFVATLLCIPVFLLIIVAIKASSFTLAAQLLCAIVALAAIAWVSLSAYSACNNALSLTSTSYILPEKSEIEAEISSSE